MELIESLFHCFINIRKYLRDAALFYRDGNKYFSMIETESPEENRERLFAYCSYLGLVLYILFSGFGLLEWVDVHFCLDILFIVGGFFFALWHIYNKVKFRLFINYVVIHFALTGSIVYLTLFLYLESGKIIFYHIYFMMISFFFIYLIRNFIRCFAGGELKESLVARFLASSGIVFFFAYNAGLSHFPFEAQYSIIGDDLIAKEYDELQISQEVEFFKDVHASLEERIKNSNEMLTIIQKFMEQKPVTSYGEGDQLIQEIESKYRHNRINYFVEQWAFQKEIIQVKTAREVLSLQEKMQKAKFSKNRAILQHALNLCRSYEIGNNEYGAVLMALSNVNEFMVNESFDENPVLKEQMTESELRHFGHNMDVISVKNMNMQRLINASNGIRDYLENQNLLLSDMQKAMNVILDE